MWITDYFAEAGRIARLPRLSPAFATDWNALEDKVHFLSTAQIDALLDYCEAHVTEDAEAVWVLTCMIPDTYSTPTMEDLLES
jgi:hypothetical protein